ncbi:hypothetical protein BT96DRAFT_950611 [Gymnopus androsaceus JB14]|uniref:Uncharacterized protein n=1 Tax=Gymnopus androsaceus JB14 TaxID=1447944 RepID=A0A6A4GGE7_9AGAR|nr:hypothetical protein BT96DRAFT_950611 [Gymnopus androsaceus JB14]
MSISRDILWPGRSVRLLKEPKQMSVLLKLWEQTIAVAQSLVNAHILHLMGVFSDKSSDLHYIVFNGSSCRSTHHLLASLLRKGVKETSSVGMRTVYGIAAGLDHFFRQHRSISQIADTRRVEILKIIPLWRKRNQKCLAMTWQIIYTFNHANYVIYNDNMASLEETSTRIILSEATQSEVHSSGSTVSLGDVSEGNVPFNENATNNEESCRREIVWGISALTRPESLIDSILESYQDRLDPLEITSSNALSVSKSDAELGLGVVSWAPGILGKGLFSNIRRLHANLSSLDSKNHGLPSNVLVGGWSSMLKAPIYLGHAEYNVSSLVGSHLRIAYNGKVITFNKWEVPTGPSQSARWAAVSGAFRLEALCGAVPLR